MINRGEQKASVVQGHHLSRHHCCSRFYVICLLTGTVATAAGFMIISNIYTSLLISCTGECGPASKWGLEPQGGN